MDDITGTEDFEPLDDSHPAWEQFELTVAELAAGYDSDAVVTHNVKQPGRVSRRRRQIDALVVGTVGFSETKVAIECKRNTTKKLGIDVVDQFVGKLLDIDADKGVLCAWGGFDAGAQARASGAAHPRIELRDLGDLEELKRWRLKARQFLRERACPNPNCLDDVALHEWPAEADGIATVAGTCGSCGTLTAECPECGEVSGIDIGTTDCWGCEVVFDAFMWPGDADVDTITVRIPEQAQ
ncbi:restriction endonuclease [Kribbella ginsengisoli]|uniref:Restriction endonuclease type IV Mrr domain-containing protein n=1 Tax=Kribbella ginsengisoli TaxID=363865 RepID=A0ABP6Z4U2_9ACTN